MLIVQIIGSLLIYSDPPRTYSGYKNIDTRIMELSKESVRNDPKRLAEALEAVWKMLPDDEPKRDRMLRDQLKHFVGHISIENLNGTSDKIDGFEIL